MIYVPVTVINLENKNADTCTMFQDFNVVSNNQDNVNGVIQGQDVSL